jgi:hypothetical protein
MLPVGSNVLGESIEAVRVDREQIRGRVKLQFNSRLRRHRNSP